MIGLSAFLFAYLYTGGPFPLAYHGLGDLFVFVYFGLLSVMGTYYLQVGFIDNNAIWLGISIGAKNVLLLTINNIRDYDGDKIVNKNTLIVKMGKKFGYLQVIGMMLLSYTGILFLSFGLNQIIIFYISILSVPLSINIFYDVYTKRGQVLNKTLGKVVMLLCLDTILLASGIFI